MSNAFSGDDPRKLEAKRTEVRQSQDVFDNFQKYASTEIRNNHELMTAAWVIDQTCIRLCGDSCFESEEFVGCDSGSQFTLKDKF